MVSYTDQQQRVIDVRNRNVLVSAAAGSGKTAVLVERLIQMILGQEISIDRLLVVTFTRAAAAEMRERISDALNQALGQTYHPEIREQLALLPGADITTIHSFCLKVIRENYSLLGLEPDFRIGEEVEIEILGDRVLADLLEAEYQRADEDFMHLVKSFATGIGDHQVEDLIRKVYLASQGMADPHRWLEFCLQEVAISDKTGLKNTGLFQKLWQELEAKLDWARLEWERLADFTQAPELGPFQEQTEYFGSILKTCQGYLQDQDYDGLYRLLKAYDPPAMPRTRKGIEPEVLAECKQKVENLRSVFADLRPYFQHDIASNLEISQNMYRLLRELVRLVLLYDQNFQAEKQGHKLIDFNDIEHMALRLLKTHEGERTEIARRYQDHYQEVVVDEYQDTNEVQDRLLELVSALPQRPNQFMVGDIKQSIYKFRQAKPEIFQHKYLTYGGIESDYAKIDMQTNFRSRPEVLKLINYLFGSIMTKEAAGIDYDEGAKFVFLKDSPLAKDYRPKLCLIEKESYQGQKESPDREELEAHAIAREIQKLLEGAKPIYDKKEGVVRPVRIEDIAILMRSPGKSMSVYGEVFLQYGLPILVDEAKAYFMTSEVRVLTDYLKILDNPRDDIALLGVLCSAIFGFEPEDLAKIKLSTDQEEFLFDRLRLYHRQMAGEIEKAGMAGGNAQLVPDSWLHGQGLAGHRAKTSWDKVAYFLEEFDRLKQVAYGATISDLVDEILEGSHYLLLVAGQPNGKQRLINLTAFVDQIRLLEKKETSSLFGFLKRLDKIKSLDLSFGEPVMEVSRAVRLMSIHKSKGLEFPVVFIGQMGKAFNIREVSSALVMKDDLGIILSDVNYQDRLIREGFQKPILKTILRREILEEEERLLYVAMTRAREYLYLVGTVNSVDKSWQKWENQADLGKDYQMDGFFGKIRPREYLLAARSYLDFVMPSVFRAHKYGLIDWEIQRNQGGEEEDGLALGDKALGQELKSGEDLANLLSRLRAYDHGENDLEFYPEYPYPGLIEEKITTSVSEQKKLFIAEDDEHVSVDDGPGVSGASRGSLYHKILSILPFDLGPDDLGDFFQSLVDKKIVSPEEREILQVEDFAGLMQSDLWQRMRAADRKGKLKREQAFILALPLKSGGVTEQKMLQGVIDVFFEEDGALVLIDYKTDRIFAGRSGLGRILKDRYKMQMTYYRQALETISRLPVKEVYLYSISHQVAVAVDQEVRIGN